MLGILGCYLKGGLGSRRQQGGLMRVFWGKKQFVFVVGGKAVGAWVLLVMCIMGWVGMGVVGREHAGHSQEGLATQRQMPEHFLCARWALC